MRYAETGFNLEIDLSRGNIERVETDPGLTELYLGGWVPTPRYCGTGFPLKLNPFLPIISLYSVPVFYAAHLLLVVIVPLFPPFLLRLC